MVDLLKLKRTNRSWIDPETDVEYRRLAGGFAWPDKGVPGFLVLIGEVWQTFDDRQHYGLLEMKLDTIGDTFAAVSKLPAEFFFTVTPPDQVDYIQDAIYRNPGIATGRMVDIREEITDDGDPSQFFGDIHRELDRRSRIGQQSIFLRDCPQTVGVVQTKIPAGWKKSSELLVAPEVSALFYGLGAFFLWKNWPIFG